LRTTRKRYLLLSADGTVDADAQKRLVKLLLERYPKLDTRKMVWVHDSLIIRTDHLTLPEMKESLVLKSGAVSLTPRLASGSISKLKRAAEPR
jgi:hypothetical protein